MEGNKVYYWMIGRLIWTRPAGANIYSIRETMKLLNFEIFRVRVLVFKTYVIT